MFSGQHLHLDEDGLAHCNAIRRHGGDTGHRLINLIVLCALVMVVAVGTGRFGFAARNYQINLINAIVMNGFFGKCIEI